ncbi:hypothetical protein WJX72_006461 [[Myrmecia] bisecta]|uniref:Protein kinase domain-containing protein n=1 Tax=[Myrmecia] bisecta TaxID=41462 RepID=A0AAW1PSJ1_9CHLO
MFCAPRGIRWRHLSSDKSPRSIKRARYSKPERQSVLPICQPEPAAEVGTPYMDPELVQRAAEFHPDLVEAVLGHGMSGDVFKYRFSSGAPAAVKLVARQSELVKHLVHEADVYLTMRSLWQEVAAKLDVLGAEAPNPASKEKWPILAAAAKQALTIGHQTTVQQKPTVHGDARLINTVARRTPGGGWEVKFVDFGWSGMEGTLS